MFRALPFLALALPLAAHAQELPKTGAAREAAYVLCHTVATVDLGDVGSNTAAECKGVVKALDGAKAFDNLTLRCLETSDARKAGYKFTGDCKANDMAGDALYFVYEGPESGPLTLLGGTGKFAGMTGKGNWSVADAPGNTPADFAFTLTYGFEWTKP